MNQTWQDSEPSEDDSTQAPTSSRKRSSRACDQCRKTKSKCERVPGTSDGVPCKSCSMAGTACTFLGPSYKRGPPKGYIHAIEQRWHQVESLLGAMLQSSDPRMQSVVSDLRRDGLAREILQRVDDGPYGHTSRRNDNSTKEDIFASILKSNEASRDSVRSKRQSRISREIVSSDKGRGLSVAPTQEWQERLTSILDSSSSKPASPTSYSQPSSATFDTYGNPFSQRRRLDTADSGQPIWESVHMYTMDDTEDRDSIKESTEAIGELSLDEQSEIRWHGRTSGLYLLRSTDQTHDRTEGGIWILPMSRIWPLAKDSALLAMDDEDAAIELPSPELQDELLDLYFTYIHPSFPVIHKSRFITEYQQFKHAGFVPNKFSPDRGTTPRPESPQKVTRLLLLSMFAISARFRADEVPQQRKGDMWDAGSNYMDSAISTLNKIFHRARPTTVQSLLLLGHREFGIGSMEQGWIYIGMAIRMAIDLGLNCDSGSWKTDGHQLLTEEETQIRRQIWWTCCLADRYGSVYMGRPVSIREEDTDVQLPDIFPDEDEQPWQPLNPSHANVPYAPVPGHVMSTLRATSQLVIIVGDIITQIYPVKPLPGKSKRASAEILERRLSKWLYDLPRELYYDTTSKSLSPPPHIAMLHVRYWTSVLLLHRAFIPEYKNSQYHQESTTRELKAFDLAQVAATHVTSIVTSMREIFSLRRPTPFLTSNLLSAGIMHVWTLAVRPDSVQARKGLQECMASLKEMEVVWPSAWRAWELLNGVKSGVTAPLAEHSSAERGYKRHAEDAFGSMSAQPTSHERIAVMQPGPGAQNSQDVQQLNSSIMAQMIGYMGSSNTSYLPGYGFPSGQWPGYRGSQEGVAENLVRDDARISDAHAALPHPQSSQWTSSPHYSNYQHYGV